MDFLTANVGQVKRVLRNGRNWLVADGTLIVADRILNGSLGPGLYPSREVSQHPQDWDGMPIVVWHPTQQVTNDETGEVEEVHVSARDPEVLDEWGVGNVHRNRFENGKHQAQFWFDEERLLNVDEKLVEMGIEPIHPRLVNGLPIELSTGLDPVKQPAKAGSKLRNGEEYAWVARQPFHPDHVAILPDQKGACSVIDGCGVNNKTKTANASVLRPTAVSGMPKQDCCAGKAPDEMCDECQKNMDGDVENFLKDAAVENATAKNNRTTNKGNPMTKTKFNRKREHAFIVANCACQDKKKLAALNKSLEAMPDEALEQVANATRVTLVVNAAKAGKLKAPVVNAHGEGEAVAGVPWTKLAQLLGVEIDPRQDPVGFAAELKGKLDEIGGKLGGAPSAPPEPPAADEPVAGNEDPEPEEEEMMTGNDQEAKTANRQVTDKEWLARAPRSVRNRLAYLDRLERAEKQKLVNRLLVNVRDKAKRHKLGEKLFNESIDQLNERIEMLGPQEDDREVRSSGSGIDWSLNSGPALNAQQDEAQQDEIAAMMAPAETMLQVLNVEDDDQPRRGKRAS